MSSPNPYQSPQAAAVAPRSKGPRAAARVRRMVALGFLAVSVALALAYSLLDEVVLATTVGGWPMLIGTCVLSLVAAAVSRDVLLSPLCCFAGTMAGDVLVGLTQGWPYAEVGLCFRLALAFSLPAAVLALALRFVVPWLRRSRAEAGRDRAERSSQT